MSYPDAQIWLQTFFAIICSKYISITNTLKTNDKRNPVYLNICTKPLQQLFILTISCTFVYAISLHEHCIWEFLEKSIWSFKNRAKYFALTQNSLNELHIWKKVTFWNVYRVIEMYKTWHFIELHFQSFITSLLPHQLSKSECICRNASRISFAIIWTWNKSSGRIREVLSAWRPFYCK